MEDKLNANKEYERNRDKLIPIAERYTNLLLNNDVRHEEWGRVFILKMDRLAVENFLQPCHYHRQSAVVMKEENALFRELQKRIKQ